MVVGGEGGGEDGDARDGGGGEVSSVLVAEGLGEVGKGGVGDRVGVDFPGEGQVREGRGERRRRSVLQSPDGVAVKLLVVGHGEGRVRGRRILSVDVHERLVRVGKERRAGLGRVGGLGGVLGRIGFVDRRVDVVVGEGERSDGLQLVQRVTEREEGREGGVGDLRAVLRGERGVQRGKGNGGRRGRQPVSFRRQLWWW